MGFFNILQALTFLLVLSSIRQVNGKTELKALMELKSALDPTNKILSSWTSNGDPCSGLFEGVACNGLRKVVNISLQGKGISACLGNLAMLRRLDLGFNQGLCGVRFPRIRACKTLDDMNINQVDPNQVATSGPAAKAIPESAIVPANCNHTTCPRSSKLHQVAIVAVVITSIVTLVIVGCLIVFRYRRQKQKIGDTAESLDGRLSIDQTKDFSRSGASPLLSLANSRGWDPLGDSLNGIVSAENHLTNFRFNLEDIESATQCFSEANILGKSSFSSVYKGILRDGSLVAIRCISLTSCKSEEAEFAWGLDLLTSLRHENLARMRGFCLSRGRGECFLIYDFASKGSLSTYLDLEDGSHQVLDWPSRVSIINGIAKGIGYLHSSDSTKPVIIHRSISVDKVLLHQHFNPMIADSGVSKILADDIVFSAIKESAAMGYLAPEYVTTGHFTQKCDVYAFGVIILQILSGKQMLSNTMRHAAQSRVYDNLVDRNLKGNFSESEAAKLARIAVDCTNELPELRPNIEVVIQLLNETNLGALNSNLNPITPTHVK